MDRLKPRESLGFLSWKVARLYTNDLAARFAEAGLKITVEQWRVLIPLYKAEGLTQGRLCELLSQEKTGVSRLVGALERRGLLTRRPDGRDRRVKLLSITDAGRELIDRSVDLVIACRDDMIRDVDPEDLAVCKRVLWQIILPTLGGECIGKEG